MRGLKISKWREDAAKLGTAGLALESLVLVKSVS